MWMKKRCRDDTIETTEPLISGDSYEDSKQDAWNQLSGDLALKLSKSVVSLALSDGQKVLFASSGIAIRCRMHASLFVTSASLVRALNKEAKEHDNVKIEVCHEGKAVTGFLEGYDLDYEIAVVKITSFLDVHDISLDQAITFGAHYPVVAVRCDIYGKLMATTGMLVRSSLVSEARECLMFSTCKLCEAWEGGPLVDILGRFVGMNLFSTKERSFFLPMIIIMERLNHFKTCQQRTAFLAWLKDFNTARGGGRLREDIPESSHNRKEKEDIPESHPKVCGETPNTDQYVSYPKPSKSGMVLVNSFEKAFGDPYRHGAVWKQLHKTVSHRLARNVVSLASFKGNTRLFACTGCFIDLNDECQDDVVSTILTSASLVRNPDPSDGEGKIVDGLRIQVVLRKRKQIGGTKVLKGTLIHCNLHCNVALVRVKNFRANYPENLKHKSLNVSSKVVAVGRCFETGHLMASSGELVNWWHLLDCKKLLYSTCKITKVGIGGPLVDVEGNFIGMNFYDPKMGTPFLSYDDIVDVLKCFKGKRPKSIGAEVDNLCTDGVDSVDRYWLSVPRPYWRQPEDPEYEYMDEYERNVVDSGCKFKYRNGAISICM